MTAGPVRVAGLAEPGLLLAGLRDDDGRWLTPVPIGGHARAFSLPAETVNRLAIIDTGVASDHPVIASRLAVSPLDVTGDGATDINGHGTVVALIALAVSPHAALISVKAMNDQGIGTRPDLLEAFQVAVEHGADVINVSAGSYDPDCVGDCFVCDAVRNLAAMGVVVVAAAGNMPGRTDCPAKAGLFKDFAISVTATDAATGTIAAYAGAGEFEAPVGPWTLVRADQQAS